MRLTGSRHRRQMRAWRQIQGRWNLLAVLAGLAFMAFGLYVLLNSQGAGAGLAGALFFAIGLLEICGAIAFGKKLRRLKAIGRRIDAAYGDGAKGSERRR